MTQAPVTVVNAGLGLTDDQIKDLNCEAFKQALKEFCQTPRLRPRGTFNNYFFRALRSLPPPNSNAGRTLAEATIREAPIIVGGVLPSAAPAVTGTAQAIAQAPSFAGQVGPVAEALAGGYQQAAAGLLGGAGVVTGLVARNVPNCLGIGQMFRTLSPGGPRLWQVLRDAGARLRFPDGLIGNRTLEIKGPHDTYRGAQEADYKSFNDPNSGFEASGAACDAEAECAACPK